MILGRQGQGLGAAKPGEAQDLRRLMHDAANGGASGVMRLTRATNTNSAALAVLVSPLPSPCRDAAFPASALALIVIKDTGDGAPPALIWLRTFHGFTESEAQVALAVFSGLDAEELAIERGVSVATVRS